MLASRTTANGAARIRMRWTVLALMATALGLLGSDCFKPFAVEGDVGIIDELDSRCAPLAGSYPAALAFEPPGNRLWVTDSPPPSLRPFTVDEVPPALVESDIVPVHTAADPDSDGDGAPDPLQPILEGIAFLVGFPLPTPFALVTANAYDEVLLLNADQTILQPLTVSVPSSGFGPADYPRLPGPGVDPKVRTALSTLACLDTDLLDSNGNPLPGDGDCDGFYARGTSGAALSDTPSGLRLFVSVANSGDTSGLVPQYLPGAVLVYSVDIVNGAVTIMPASNPRAIYTTGFNPSHVTAYSVGTRDYILVAVSGVIQSTLGTPEGGRYKALKNSAIDVIDADSLKLIATIPLGPAGIIGDLAVDSKNRIAVLGSQVGRWLFAVDLTPLEAAGFPGASLPVTLDDQQLDPDFGDAVLHDSDNPIKIEKRGSGGAGSSCPGLTSGIAFDAERELFYATDYCDGTLSVVTVTLGSPPVFTPLLPIAITAAIDAAGTTSPRGPGALAVRPGPVSPGDTTSELFVLISEPEGQLCAIDVELGP
jgi:hypothetical protein